MSCDVGEVPMTQVKQRKGCRMSYDVDKAAEGLENSCTQVKRSKGWRMRLRYITAHSPTLLLLYLHHSSFYNPSSASPTSQVILQHFRCFTHVTAHSPTLPPLYLHHSSFYNPPTASPTSQVILQPFRCFTYVSGTSRTSPGEPPMHRGMKKQSVLDQLVAASY